MTTHMEAQRVNQNDLFAQLPPEWPEDLLPAIKDQVKASGRKVVVLDDDPTGTQTIHGIPVLTEWPTDLLADELRSSVPAVYLLTNSRSLPLNQAQALNHQIGASLLAAQEQSGQDFVLVSRSDSTLRGHFPGEVTALAQGLGHEYDAWLVVPFFIEGGRYTINDIHYVAEGELLTPAGQTEFARDKAFGYQASNLREWVAEKTGGHIPASQVASISIDLLRQEGPERVARQLLELPKGSVCICNAASYRDLEVFVLGLLQAEAAGKRYLYRTAASFVRVRAGIDPHPLLTRSDITFSQGNAGLIVVGSYVPKTSAQLDSLLHETNFEALEVFVDRLMNKANRAVEIDRVCQEANRLLSKGYDVVVYTSRQLVSAEGADNNLVIGRNISDSLVEIVQGLQTQPRYLLAKGGITSSDVATRGLGIRRAWVMGQILPGVPVWQSGPESRFPGMPYIVFPGNVGGPDALARIAQMLGR